MSTNPHGFGRPGMRHHYVGGVDLPRSSTYISHIVVMSIARQITGMTATAVRGEDFARHPIYKMRQLRSFWDEDTKAFRREIAQAVRRLRRNHGRRCGRPRCPTVEAALRRYPPRSQEPTAGHVSDWEPGKLPREETTKGSTW